ncbi:MAG: hypothetical protein LAT62_04615 [Natronospirillum sp.]|uniref:hypothetical protein n=1 Tax=Natronospirillum sp. TaxID=2812955 RepID=UPI0025F63723|nr:hypothetical protein [Natronospirillum sp.]MCH8551197.1 hypothetical protein [Natronospirillum sp.]
MIAVRHYLQFCLKSAAVVSLLLWKPVAGEPFSPEQLLEYCAIDGQVYRHTALGYPASRVDWGFMSIDGQIGGATSVQCMQSEALALRLIAESFAQLERELVQGPGIYTRSLLGQLGCSAEMAQMHYQTARTGLPEQLDLRPSDPEDGARRILWYLALLEPDQDWPCLSS